MARCTLCGGNHGHMPDGRHNLCAARAERGLATPSLGDACAPCQGRGHLGRVGAAAMLDFGLGPAKIRRAIDAVFPICGACGGKGHG